MNFSKLLSLILFIPLVSAQFRIGNEYFDISNPSTLLQNDWVVFGGVFLLVFALVYLALSKQFGGGMKSNKAFPWLQEPASSESKGAIIVVSLIIAFFCAALFVQRNWINGIFGEAIAGWLFLLMLAIIVILSIPFFKMLRLNVGTGPAIAITFLMIWATLKYLIDPYNLISSSGNFDNLFEIYNFVTSFVFLLIALAVGILFAVIKNSGRR